MPARVHQPVMSRPAPLHKTSALDWIRLNLFSSPSSALCSLLVICALGWCVPHLITKLTPMQGFCAETGGAATLFMATWLGVPVSTSHTITGAIVGVGAARRVSAVRWNVASSIVYAWVITIPASGIVAALTYWAVVLLR